MYYSEGSLCHPLTACGLSVSFGGRRVLTDLDLVASPGRGIGLVGENGSAKSTLLRALAGTLPRTAEITATSPARTTW